MRFLFLLLFLLVSPSPSLSADCLKSYPKTDVHVLDVSDSGTFLLSDNRQVKLADVLLPYAPRSLPKGNDWLLFKTSVSELRRVSKGKNIQFVQSEKWMNRYGVWSGHIRITSQDKVIWLQKHLVEEGMVRLTLTDRAYDCFSKLLPIEDLARRAGKGIWANNAYRVLAAGDVWPLIRLRGTFQIVEGTVRKVAEVKGRYYLNFGKNWRDDFTIKISRRSMRFFRKKGIKPQVLKGKKVRVRGWIRIRNGPLIEIEHPVQIEALE